MLDAACRAHLCCGGLTRHAPHGMVPTVPSQAASQLKLTVAANLDRAMIEKRLTNRAVAESIGATEHQVWRWRKAKHMPELARLVALARELFDGDIARFYDESEQNAA